MKKNNIIGKYDGIADLAVGENPIVNRKVNDAIACDTSVSGLKLYLPANPISGALFRAFDYKGNAQENPVELYPEISSHSINGGAAGDTVMLDVNNFDLTFVYNNDTANWQIVGS